MLLEKRLISLPAMMNRSNFLKIKKLAYYIMSIEVFGSVINLVGPVYVFSFIGIFDIYVSRTFDSLGLNILMIVFLESALLMVLSFFTIVSYRINKLEGELHLFRDRTLIRRYSLTCGILTLISFINSFITLIPADGNILLGDYQVIAMFLGIFVFTPTVFIWSIRLHFFGASVAVRYLVWNPRNPRYRTPTWFTRSTVQHLPSLQDRIFFRRPGLSDLTAMDKMYKKKKKTRSSLQAQS